VLKSFLIALAVLFSGSTLSLFPLDAEAKRLGKGKSAGMQRQMPPKQPEAAPNQAANAATPAAAPAAAGTAGAAAAAGKRSWLGPIAGLAAGLGIAALLSQMGFGEFLIGQEVVDRSRAFSCAGAFLGNQLLHR
jgi:hypothetical protein